jgi:hypothetical protein
MGEFLKGYMQKKMDENRVLAGYAQGGDSRGLAQACDKAMDFRSVAPRC